MSYFGNSPESIATEKVAAATKAGARISLYSAVVGTIAMIAAVIAAWPTVKLWIG